MDASEKWERYSLLNMMYKNIYNYEKNIKPAPDPYHTLEKFYGTLTIEEYRKLLHNDNMIIVTNKPLSKKYPEIYEENNITPNINHNNLLYKKTAPQLRLRRNHTAQSKTNIISSSFNL